MALTTLLLPLVSLHLFVICLTVLGNEFELLTSLDSGSYELLAPSYLVADSPKPHHHHFHHKTAHGPVKQPPIEQEPVKPLPPSQTPVKPQPPSQVPVVKPQPPSQVPVIKPLPPSHAPVVKPQPPSQTPVKPIPQRSLVAVQGVVYCKPCKFSGIDTLLGSTPLLGANVELHCNNTKFPKIQQAKTDKNGYFFMLAQNNLRLTTFGAHKCKVILGPSNDPKCNRPTNLHYGLQGSILLPKNQPNLPKALPYQLYTVGPFAYESATKCAP